MVQKYRRMLKPAFLGLVVRIELVTGVHLDSYLSTCQVNASYDKIFSYIDYFLLPTFLSLVQFFWFAFLEQR